VQLTADIPVRAHSCRSGGLAVSSKADVGYDIKPVHTQRGQSTNSQKRELQKHRKSIPKALPPSGAASSSAELKIRRVLFDLEKYGAIMKSILTILNKGPSWIA
jgi:hypothetical protein